jgi:hypothetical protein
VKEGEGQAEQWLSEDWGLLAAWEGAAAQKSQALQEETVAHEKLQC